MSAQMLAAASKEVQVSGTAANISSCCVVGCDLMDYCSYYRFLGCVIMARKPCDVILVVLYGFLMGVMS